MMEGLMDGCDRVACLMLGALFGVMTGLACSAMSYGLFGGGQWNAFVFGAAWLSVMLFGARKAQVI